MARFPSDAHGRFTANHVPHQPETLYPHQKPEVQAAAEYPI
jgi:hypothetical protein